jgi:acyl-CoA synthetase (AMP-forming)/AMP-acid ligase II
LTAREEHATLSSRFLRSAALFPERPALEVAGATLTYSELHRRARGIARVLQEQDPGSAAPPQLTGVVATRSV